MENLAALYVVLVTFVSSIAPQANLPQVLGVQVSEDTVSEARDTRESHKRATNEIKAEFIQAKQDFQNKRKEALEEAKIKREELREKLQTIKDAKKKEVVENLDSKLAMVNNKWVSHWNDMLSRLNSLLEKVDSKAQEFASREIDVILVNAAIESAQARLADAQNAVNSQAGKNYVTQITTEGKLGTDVKTTTSQFRTDINSTKEKIYLARKAVEEAIKAIKNLGSGLPKPSPVSDQGGAVNAATP